MYDGTVAWVPGGNRQKRDSALGLWVYAGEGWKIQKEMLMSDLQNNKATCHKNDERAGQTSLRFKGEWGVCLHSAYILCGELSYRIHPSVCPEICPKTKKCKWLKEALASMPQQKKSGWVQLELTD